MTQREKLVDMIQNAVEGCARYWAEVIADHLLHNGVIVPPCKVGDTMYRIDTDGKIINERVDEIHLEFILVDDSEWQNAWFLREHNIGKTTFLTREEAEKALKERETNNYL